ncbi:MAG TPA: 4-hydroxythreonine-4-phosphate dehydrogenase PdxA [Myxococcota bacterium]|nr:4-hydroxythreonine-4-phosphate dehydrogenase PdxA [Myxococcota bacterium]
MSDRPRTPRLRVGLTVGDPAGIGPEVVAAALRALARDDVELRVYGDLEAVARAGGAVARGQGRPFASAAVEPGRPDPAAAAGIVAAVRAAARDCLAGELDAMATAPLSKEIVGAGGFAYPGHTELLEEVAGGRRALMLLVGRGLRVALATIHCALREVPERLSREGIASALEILDADLEARFRIREPRIAVCGLNPHAGEGGRFGDEEARIIAPALADARARAIDARGPFSGDSVFHRALSGEFDAVLAMYHDQGLGPLKTHAFGQAVNVTLGLPLVRTSVDHGTAFDIAGQGKADPGSMIEAVRLAVELARNERQARGRE